MMTTNLIEQLEELAANAWPAAVVQVIDGWRLRFSWGITRRANSVWPNQSGHRYPLEEKVAIVADFYARWGQPARYQLCPAAQPGHLDSILAEQGYDSDALTAVQIAPLNTVLTRSSPNPAYEVTVREGLDERWFAAYCQIEGIGDQAAQARRTIMERIGPRAGYALLQTKERPVAVGMGVTEQGWAGIFGMATHPKFRRRGAATAVLHALANWSQHHQATHLYLQVMEINSPAKSLYAGVGFETLYHYHYREASQT